MEIIYLTDLQNFSSINYVGDIIANKPISIEEILDLEKQFNNGNVFPKALRELLFLAGSSCKLLDYAIFSQKELQEFIIEDLKEEGLTMERPFYVLEIYDAGSLFYFVYLEEGENPAVYVAKNEHEALEIIKVGNSLSAFLSHLIQCDKEDIGWRNGN